MRSLRPSAIHAARDNLESKSGCCELENKSEGQHMSCEANEKGSNEKNRSTTPLLRSPTLR